MRKAPINYLLSYAVLALIWILAAVLVGNYLGENVALANSTVEDFSQVYQIVMAIGAVASAVALSYWYHYGSRDSAATDLAGARRLWSGWFFFLIIVSVGCIAGIMVCFRNEPFTLAETSTMFGCASAVSWVPFWICSLLMTPRGVKHAPVGMR